MKRYKLLKDTPEVKAGAIFAQQGDGELIVHAIPNSDDDSVHFHKHMIKNFDEWFEETKYETWAINTLSSRVEEISNIAYSEGAIKNLKSFGLLFYTKEEAEKHLEWLKARAVLLEDTKLKTVVKEDEYSVAYDKLTSKLFVYKAIRERCLEIVFSSREDAENSIKTHEKEWKSYLGLNK